MLDKKKLVLFGSLAVAVVVVALVVVLVVIVLLTYRLFRFSALAVTV